jgi:hypothetical protein
MMVSPVVSQRENTGAWMRVFVTKVAAFYQNMTGLIIIQTNREVQW